MLIKAWTYAKSIIKKLFLLFFRNGNLNSSHNPLGSSLLSHLTIYPIYHKPMPNLPAMTPLQFEVLLFGYLMATLTMQYMNIYKTVSSNIWHLNLLVGGKLFCCYTSRFVWHVPK